MVNLFVPTTLNFWAADGDGFYSIDGSQSALSSVTTDDADKAGATLYYIMEVRDYVNGRVRVGAGSNWEAFVASSGIYTGVIIPDNDGALKLQADSDGDLSARLKLYQISNAAPFTSILTQDGNELIGGSGGVSIDKPKTDIREHLAQLTQQKKLPEWFSFDGDATETQFTLPIGWKPKEVQQEGARKREGALNAWTKAFDGYNWIVTFAVAPALDDEIEIQAEAV